jgi:cysteine desulfurase
MKRIYLDNAATMPLLPRVKNRLVEALADYPGNASSLHTEGRAARAEIEKARTAVADLIGAQPSEIVFTSGGTEANNMVFNTFWGQRTVVSNIEHPSVFEPFLRGAGKNIRNGNVLRVDRKGLVRLGDLEDLFRDETIMPKPKLVSIMLANNETGTIQDIQKIAELAHQYRAFVHTDATQAIGKIPVGVDKLGVDYMTVSAHKIGGPKGVGALYARAGCPLEPLLRGGHQEKRLRAGTENTLGIIGFGVAAELAVKTPAHYRAKIQPLRGKLREGILQQVPAVVVNGDQTSCLPHILNLSFAGVEGESMMLALDEAGIALSTGSACASDDINPSHVLMALGADPELAHGSLRFSLGLDTTDADIDYVLEQLPPIVERLRRMSTVGVDYDK